MSDTTCPRCGTAFESASPVERSGVEAVCPRCALQFALGTGRGGAATVLAADARIGTTFRGMEIESLLGRGGMGVVYRARQPHLDRVVALKLIAGDLARDAEFVERFKREARVMSSLQHPNIVSVLEFGFEEGVPYLVMELVEGANLRSLLRVKKLAPSSALKLVPQVCEALEYAHGKGVVHRDIKPENLLVTTDGTVKITDFGLARSADNEPGLTRSDVVMGTPHYMAPEQVENPKSVDHRADIYSLGVVIYEMLTGELPLGKFQPPSQRAVVARELDGIVLKALEKQPAERWQHASELRHAVGGVGSGERASEEEEDGDNSWFLGFLIPGIVVSLVGALPDSVPKGVKTALIMLSSVGALLWVFAPPKVRALWMRRVVPSPVPIGSGPLKGIHERLVWLLATVGALIFGAIPVYSPEWPFSRAWLWGPSVLVGVLALCRRVWPLMQVAGARSLVGGGLLALGGATLVLYGLTLFRTDRVFLIPAGATALIVGCVPVHRFLRLLPRQLTLLLPVSALVGMALLGTFIYTVDEAMLFFNWQKSWDRHLMGTGGSTAESSLGAPDARRRLEGSSLAAPEDSPRSDVPQMWFWGRHRFLYWKSEFPFVGALPKLEPGRHESQWDLRMRFDEKHRVVEMNPVPPE